MKKIEKSEKRNVTSYVIENILLLLLMRSRRLFEIVADHEINRPRIQLQI